MTQSRDPAQVARPRRMLVVVLAAALVAPAFAAAAESDRTWTQKQKLITSDGESDDRIGWDLDADGDRLLVGAKWDDTADGTNAGAAYVFVRDANGTWTEEAKLTASDGAVRDSLGESVALDGDTALVGADDDDNANGESAGAAYVFNRTGGSWTQEAKLTASDGTDHDDFGFRVSLDGDRALVSAWLDDGSGSAYVFNRTGGSWTEEAKLTPSDRGDNDRFGVSASLDNDTAVVGAYVDDNTNGENAGAAYVFNRSGDSWTEQAKLTASDGAADDWFGASVSLDGDQALIGAMFDDNLNGVDSGSVYVFNRSGGSWTQEAKLTPSDGASRDRFGANVILDGRRAAAGATRHDGLNGLNSGSAYVLAQDAEGTWTEQARLVASDGQANAGFGATVEIEGDTAMFAAVDDDNANGEDAGAVYVFRALEGSTEEGPEDETQNDAGTGGDASDDPDNPTRLPGGTVIHVNGTLVPGIDEIDAYGTNVSKDTTRSINFTFQAPAGMGLHLRFLDPDGVEVDNDTAPLSGGNVTVEKAAPSGSFLDAGVWVLVLEHASNRTDALGSNVTVTGGDIGPNATLPGFSPFDYQDERECDPKC